MSNRKAILVVGRTKQEAEAYAEEQKLPSPYIAVGADLLHVEGLVVTQVIVLTTVNELTDRQLGNLSRLPLQSLPRAQSIDSIRYRHILNEMRDELNNIREELATLKGV